nr:hypothetical protein [Tanacetum cinerariifolium]
SSEQVKSPRHMVQPIDTSIPAATPAPVTLKSTSSGKRRNRKTCFICKSVDRLIKDCDYHAKKMAQPTQRNYAHKGNHKQLAHPIVIKSKSPIKRNIPRSPSPKTSNSPPRVTAAQAPVVSAAQGASMTLKWFDYNDALGRSKSDNGTEFKNSDLNQFCGMKGIKREFSVPRTPHSAQSRKQNGKAKKEAKGKSPVESVTRYRDLNADFKDCSDNSSNEVNAAGSIV